jgi:hypothetical protein
MISSRANKIVHWVKSFALWKYRQATWRNRPLPDFIIIGAQKCGTTSLYHFLAQHPQLTPSYVKEVHFFDGGPDPRIDNFRKGPAWYRAHFPLMKTVSTRQKTFEASPMYIFNPLVPKRIADLVPEVKLIALLRDPTERAISHYFHERRKGREPLGIMEALQSEEARLGPVLGRQDYKNDIFGHQSYKSRGLYHDQLERYLHHFQRESFLLINSEKLLTEPQNSLRRIFEFVEVDAGVTIDDLQPRHVTRNRSKITPDVYEYLKDYFRTHNQALYELVGEDYGW